MTKASRHGLAFGLTILAATAPVLAKDKKPVDPDKKVCRSDVATGSVMPKSTCRTAAQWARIDAANSASAQGMLQGTTRTGTPR